MTPAQLVLRWNLKRWCSVVPRSTQPQHIAENATVAVTGSNMGSKEEEDMKSCLDSLPQVRRVSGDGIVGKKSSVESVAVLWDE